MEKTFDQRIQETHLTKTGRKIADYFQKNKSVLAFQPLSVIATQLDISDISIVRFSRALGYDGFTDLKQHVQKELAAVIDGELEDVNTLAKFTASMELQQVAHLENPQQICQRYSGMIEKTMGRNSLTLFEQAADQIIASRNHYVVGQFSRLGAVETLHSLLLPLLPNIFCLTEWGFEAFTMLMNMGHDDCVILFSFGRLTQLESEVVATAKKVGAHIIVITDRSDTPPTVAADVTLYSKANIGLPFYSGVCNVMIAEILADLISRKTWAVSKERMANMNMQIAALTK